MARLLPSVLASCLMLAAVPALAADVTPGTYFGSMMDGARPVRVEVVVDAATGGAIKFGEPWACRFGLQYAGPRDAVQVYSFTGAGAGRCSPLSLGYAELTPGDGKLDLGLFDQSQKRRQQAILTAQ